MNRKTKALIAGGALACLTLLGRGVSQHANAVEQFTQQVAPTPTRSRSAAEERGRPTATVHTENTAYAPGGPTLTSGTEAQTLEKNQQQLQRELEELLKTKEFREMMGRIERKEKLSKADLEFMGKAWDIKGRMIPEPPLFKAPGYPPKTPEAAAMWDWWHKMQKTDPNFEFKRPIAFYGKVVDEEGVPIPNANISISITGPQGSSEVKTQSDAKGSFSLKDEKGKFIIVDMRKQGYGRGPRSHGTFEYAEFFSERFHVPDPNNPVIFVLPRLKQ